MEGSACIANISFINCFAGCDYSAILLLPNSESLSQWYNPFSWNWNDLFGRQPIENIGVDGIPSKNDKSFFVLPSGKKVWLRLDNEADYKRAYLQCAPLKAIINRRAQMFVNGEIEIINTNTQNKKRGEKAKMLRDVLKKPNILQSWKQFFAQFHIYIDLFGYCPVLKIYPTGMEGQGLPSAMWCLPPWLFDVEFTGKWRNQTELKGIYKEFYLNFGGNKIPLGVDNVALVLDNSIGTDDDANLLMPDSRVKANEGYVSNWIASMKSRNTLITKKGAIGILSNMAKDVAGPVKLDKESKQAVQDDFARYGLTGEEWQVIVTDSSLQWQSMSFPTKDMMLFEEVDDCKQGLCDGIGLYYDIMAKTKASTFANLGEAKKAQYQDYIIPDCEARLEQLSQSLWRKDENAALKVSYDHLEVLQQSAKEKADAMVSTNTAYEKLWEKGLCTKNNWCTAVGIEELASDGDKYIYETSGDPLAVKLGVGGLQALQAILESTTMKKEQKKDVLIYVFGIEAATADKLAGEDPEPSEKTDPLNPKFKNQPEDVTA